MKQEAAPLLENAKVGAAGAGTAFAVSIGGLFTTIQPMISGIAGILACALSVVLIRNAWLRGKQLKNQTLQEKTRRDHGLEGRRGK